MKLQLLSFSVTHVETYWSLTQPNQSTTTLSNISNISTDDSMVNCISQPIKLDDLILITEPRSLTEMGDVGIAIDVDILSHIRWIV